MELDEDVPNKNVAIIAPTYQQAIDIYYPLLAYQLGMEEHTIKSSRVAGTFWFPKNVQLKIWSYEASERMRGSGQYFVVADEVCYGKVLALASRNLGSQSYSPVYRPVGQKRMLNATGLSRAEL